MWIGLLELLCVVSLHRSCHDSYLLYSCSDVYAPPLLLLPAVFRLIVLLILFPCFHRTSSMFSVLHSCLGIASPFILPRTRAHFIHHSNAIVRSGIKPDLLAYVVRLDSSSTRTSLSLSLYAPMMIFFLPVLYFFCLPYIKRNKKLKLFTTSGCSVLYAAYMVL